MYRLLEYSAAQHAACLPALPGTPEVEGHLGGDLGEAACMHTANA